MNSLTLIDVRWLDRILDETDALINVLWNDTLVFYSGYTCEALMPLMEKLCSLIVKSETSKFQVRDAHSLESARVFTALAKIVKWTRLLQAVRKKYSASKFYNISTIHHLKSPVVNVFANKALKNWSCIVVHFSLIFFSPNIFYTSWRGSGCLCFTSKVQVYDLDLEFVSCPLICLFFSFLGL